MYTHTSYHMNIAEYATFSSISINSISIMVISSRIIITTTTTSISTII